MTDGASARRRYRPRLRTVFLLVNLLVIALPLAGVGVLRLYESALVRQTESALIGQAAIVAAAYKVALRRQLAANGRSLADYGTEVGAAAPDGPWRPRPATLDFAVDPVLPRPPEAFVPPTRADPLAQAAGRELMPALREAQFVTLAGIRVLDADGVVVATTGEELRRSLANREEVARALGGETVSVMRDRVSDEPPPALASISRGSRVRVFVAMPVLDGNRLLGVVVLSRTARSLFQALYGKRRAIAGAAGLLLAVVLGISLATSFLVTRPVQAVIRQTERASRGEAHAVIPLERPGTREIARLSESVARMAQSLEQRSGYLRTFASHVSHGLKTPLTAIRGTVELLREHLDDMSAGERGRFLANLEADTDRLARSVARLLELARADVAPVGERCDASDVIDRVAARYRGAGRTVRVVDGDGAGAVAIGEDALDAVLTNLLDNAFQHGGPAVSVDLRARRDAGAAVLLVEDDGRGVSEANAGRIFDPFFTTARGDGGTGLGLAVVRALVEAHGGEIRLRPRERGAAFEIRVPLA